MEVGVRVGQFELKGKGEAKKKEVKEKRGNEAKGRGK